MCCLTHLLVLAPILSHSAQSTTSTFLSSFFEADNSHVLDRQLSLFGQLITYHDPELAVHLWRIRFAPDLYAYPWLFTLFAREPSAERVRCDVTWHLVWWC